MSFLKRLFGSPEKQPDSQLPELPTEPVSKRLVLEELRNVFSNQLNAADSLDDKLKELLGAASLILTLVTTLQITTGIEQIGWPYLIGLVFALSFYVILIIVILRALRPVKYRLPIPSDWDEIAERFFPLDEEAALELLIINYLEYNSENSEFTRYKAARVRWVSFLLVMITFALIAMGLFGLSGNVTFPWQNSPLPTPIP